MSDATFKYSHSCKACQTKTFIPMTKSGEQYASHSCSGMSCDLVFYQCGFCNKVTRAKVKEIHRHQKQCPQYIDTTGESNDINASTSTHTSLETPIRAALTSGTKTCSQCSHVITLTQPNDNVSDNSFNFVAQVAMNLITSAVGVCLYVNRKNT